MTSEITVKAHCGNNKEVVVKVYEKGIHGRIDQEAQDAASTGVVNYEITQPSKVSALQDGESVSMVFYDDMVITSQEVVKKVGEPREEQPPSGGESQPKGGPKEPYDLEPADSQE